MKLIKVQDVVELINGESIEWLSLPDIRLYLNNPDEQTFRQIDMYIEKDSILGNYYFVGAYND